jgi:hypothetical protein
MTDLAEPLTTAFQGTRRRVVPTLATGVFGGLLLGILARAWMRLIAEDPEFTWSGTIFIVGGFTIFGFTQSVAALVRSRATRRWTLTLARVLGTIGMLPLFVAAGGLMLPTVVGGGLAVARVQWHRVLRGICLLVAAVPVVFVGHQLVGSFGWSLHTVAGFVAMLAIYSTIVWATRFTFTARSAGNSVGR